MPSAETPTCLADHPLLISLGFNFKFSNWKELEWFIDQSATKRQMLYDQTWNISDASNEFFDRGRSAGSIYVDHIALLREHSRKMNDKLYGYARILDKVERTAKEQAVLIMRAMVDGEKECEVDSLFALGTKIHFIHGGHVEWHGAETSIYDLLNFCGYL